MKIALIGTTLFHQGAEFVLAALARGLAAHGHDVTVILSKYHEDWQKANPDWKPFELPSSVRVIIQPKRRARESVFSFRRLIRAGHYDVVMCHSGSYTYPLAIATRLMRRRPVLIHVEHSNGVETDINGRPIRPKFSFVRLFKLWAMSKMDAQFTVSEGTADAIARMDGYPRDRIYTVYNPVVDDAFKKKVSHDPTHPWLRETSIPVVMAAAAFCSFKNHVLLIRAFAKVLEKAPARLIIFGEGPLRSEYEKLIADLGIAESVSLPGFTNNLPAEMKAASCFVVSSTIESFSVVLVEALAAGAPVVSTNCPYGPPEILRGGEYGVLVKNNDVAAMADGILKVLKGGGVKPTAEMVAPYTMESVVARYEKAMNEVIERIGNVWK